MLAPSRGRPADAADSEALDAYALDFDRWRHAALAFVEAHRAWTPAIAGVLAFCESLAVLSLFVPATVILVGIGALIGASGLPFWPVMSGAAVGAALGDWLSYEVGAYLEDGVKRAWPMRRHPGATARAEAFLRRWGAGAVAIGRFFGPLRAVVPLIAGSFGVGRVPFQVANWGSAVVWAFVLLAPGAGLLAWFKG